MKILIGKPGVTDKATRAACARVAELRPVIRPFTSRSARRAGPRRRIAGARAELVQAEAEIANLPTGASDAWHRLIEIYTELAR